MRGGQVETLKALGGAMDWKTALSTFAMILLAEMGDKTQLVTFSFAARFRSPFEVFVGAGSALLLTTLVAVLFGDVITRVLPSTYIRYMVGILFIVFGGWILMAR